MKAVKAVVVALSLSTDGDFDWKAIPEQSNICCMSQSRVTSVADCLRAYSCCLSWVEPDCQSSARKLLFSISFAQVSTSACMKDCITAYQPP